MKKAWVVTVDMGYGHQRAAYPLKDIAHERILTANKGHMISYDETKLWEKTRYMYEFVSRVKEIPIIGKPAWGMYDKFQKISPLFPFRDLSKPTLQTYAVSRFIKKGLCSSLIDYIKKKDLPMVATHPFPALAAQYYGLDNIYCVVTDTDINRIWVPENSKENRITFFAPCIHVAVRLREYGIKEEKIILTGFPLPKENIGGNDYSILKKDLAARIYNLDPNKAFMKSHKELLDKKLPPIKKSHPLTITYLVGGAGAETSIGIKIAKSLRKKILSDKIKLNLVAGVRMDVRSKFLEKLQKLGLNNKVNVIFSLSKKDYFSKINKELRTTDIIWTKPSEMSFFAGLGIPVIIAPPIGAHEEYNKKWLNHIAAGFVQEDPEYVNDWLFYWMENGRLAEAAYDGWSKAPTLGTYKIEKNI